MPGFISEAGEVRADGVQQPDGPARGVELAGGRRQVVIKMDTSQFDEVRERVIRENTSLAEQIRLLIEWGLEADA